MLDLAEQRVCNGKECGHLKAFKRENNLCNQCQRAWLISCWPAKPVSPGDSSRARWSDTEMARPGPQPNAQIIGRLDLPFGATAMVPRPPGLH